MSKSHPHHDDGNPTGIGIGAAPPEPLYTDAGLLHHDSQAYDHLHDTSWLSHDTQVVPFGEASTSFGEDHTFNLF